MRNGRVTQSSWLMGLMAIGAILSLAGCSQMTSDAGHPLPGGAFDAAPFGFPLQKRDGKVIGVQWAEPRKIRRVVVEFDKDAQLPPPEKVRLQYWQRIWNGRPDPILAEAGAGRVGWAEMDDWTNGAWKDADTRVQADGQRWQFTFAPTGAKEFPKLGQPGVSYRKTLKLRLLSDGPLPQPVRFEASTDAVYRPLLVRISFGQPAAGGISVSGEDEGRVEIYNGALRNVSPLGNNEAHKMPDGSRFRLTRPNALFSVELLMAVDPVESRYDHTIVTVRTKQRPFSFDAEEVARGGRILIDDLGVLVTRNDDAITLEGYRQARKEFAGKTIHQRVTGEPEQTWSRAWNDMPLKRPLWFVHGLPGDRNAIRQVPNGGIELSSRQRWFKLQASPRDSQRKGWPGGGLRLEFGQPGDDLRGGRELRDGYLPELRTWWQDGPIYYEQSAILDALDADLDKIELDDPTLLLMRFRVVNTSPSQAGTARLLFTSRPEQESEKLVLEGDRVMGVAKDAKRFRYIFDRSGQGSTAAEADGVRWSLDLPPGQAHDVYLLIPTITLTEDGEIESLRGRKYDADSERICRFWKQQTDRGAQIETPEPVLNGFYKAHIRHMLVNCFKELKSDRLHAHVGTFAYGVYPDESGMMISDLDRRGYHDEAGRCLESFLHYQGTVEMPGNFKSKEGLFYGSGGHETGGYNKSHGWVMWLMAEHWWFTRDRDWMEKAAPKLVAACDWVKRERQATMTTAEDGSRPIDYGFLPTGSLEDVTDYWHWLVTNVCTVWGCRALSAALADFGHPDAARVQSDAEAFRSDVMRGLTEARTLAPVVKLRDGTYVPKYPSRLYERGRCHGWLRETLEGSIHLLITGLLEPDAPEAKWILNDFEDNLYVSSDYGYAIPSFDSFWFSRGGFSMQANLLGGPLPYLYRDEIKHFLRAYFNSLASAFYPDIKMCNEHSLPELGYPAGDHFKTSDESQSTYWLRLMFVNERGGDLYLGQAIPRYWLTPGRTVGITHAASYFGPLSLKITAQEDGRIKAVVTPPQRNRPRNIYVRIRQPDSKPIKSVKLNNADYDKFDAAKEWIILPGTVEGTQEIVARYD